MLRRANQVSSFGGSLSLSLVLLVVVLGWRVCWRVWTGAEEPGEGFGVLDFGGEVCG